MICICIWAKCQKYVVEAVEEPRPGQILATQRSSSCTDHFFRSVFTEINFFFPGKGFQLI